MLSAAAVEQTGYQGLLLPPLLLPIGGDHYSKIVSPRPPHHHLHRLPHRIT